ncbi:TetR family transcriptional regulator [Rhodococcus corynebacterioides]|nr:TetR family transcriptional regulator [Rhodococcus corynebacterioides]
MGERVCPARRRPRRRPRTRQGRRPPRRPHPGERRDATGIRNQGSIVGDIAEVLGVSKRTLYRHFSVRVD